jgi:heme-degrading monooxygenase HmoA
MTSTEERSVSVLEHVVLTIDPARAGAYEAAFHEARPLIEAQPGCGGARLVRVLETPGRYVLLVEWASLEDHMVGFRSSAQFPRWRELLHHFYLDPPEVEHGSTV